MSGKDREDTQQENMTEATEGTEASEDSEATEVGPEGPSGSSGRDSDRIAEASPGDTALSPPSPPKSTKKGRKSRKKDSKSLKPTEEEILSRMLEKNQLIVKLNKKISEKEKTTKELNDKYLRSIAEFENYRKRMRKEWELLQHQTKAEVILEVLNVVDDFERAFSVVGENEGDDFIQGMRLIYNKLVLTLEKLGVSPIEALGKIFDPAHHMAIAQVESEEAEPNHVTEVVQNGYLLGDTVIRPAKVIIAK